MPKLSEVLEAIARNTPWSQHYPHDADLLAEFVEQLKAEEDKSPRPRTGGKT